MECTIDPREAASGADVVVTDTFVSMGREDDYEKRIKDFEGFQVDKEVISVYDIDKYLILVVMLQHIEYFCVIVLELIIGNTVYVLFCALHD